MENQLIKLREAAPNANERVLPEMLAIRVAVWTQAGKLS